MSHELKFFLIRLSVLIILSPVLGFFLYRFLEYFEACWKTGSKKKRWAVSSLLFFMLACIGGFLQ